LKIWASGILINVVSWVTLYLVFQAVGGHDISFIIMLSLGVLVVLAVSVAGNHLKKQL
jgi:hypothetical protein